MDTPPSSLPADASEGLPWWLTDEYMPITQPVATLSMGVFSVGFGGLLTAPVIGAHARVLANYRPLIDAGTKSRAAGRRTGLLKMIRDVWRTEGGRAGLWRGAQLCMLEFAISWAVGWVFTPSWKERRGLDTKEFRELGRVIAAPLSSILLHILITSLATLPAHVFWIRRVLRPYTIRTTSNSSSLFSRITSILRAPGLLPAFFLLNAIPYLETALEERFLPERLMLTGTWQGGYFALGREAWLRGAMLAVGKVVVAVGVNLPLWVLIIRLAMQEGGSDAIGKGGNASVATSEADIVVLRPPGLPRYTGLIDVARTVIREEGWRALFVTWEWYLLEAIPSLVF